MLRVDEEPCFLARLIEFVGQPGNFLFYITLRTLEVLSDNRMLATYLLGELANSAILIIQGA